MGRVETLFSLVRAHAALKFPWLGQIKLRFCDLADADHRKKWRQFAHTNHAVYTVCFARAAEDELSDEEILGMSAHELGHVVGKRLRYPEHTRAIPSKKTPKKVQDEADRIAVKVLGFEGLRYNHRTLQEISTIDSVLENPEPARDPAFEQAWKAFPKFLMSFDPLGHTKVSDLVFLAESEIDFYNEGQDLVDIETPRQLKAVQAFVRKFKGK